MISSVPVAADFIDMLVISRKSLKDQMAKDPTEVIHKAVLHVFPRNKLHDVRVIA